MNHIADAVSCLCPNISFKVGSSYDSIEFINPPNSFTPPSEEEIQTKLAELNAAEPMRQLRIQRNQLLASTDWRMTTDYPYSDQADWASYRTQLRDLPQHSSPALDENGNLTNVDWPTPPDQI